jgi:hypothetical protein
MTETIEFVDSLGPPLAIRPSQFFASQRRQALSKTAEHQLLIAVLDDAIQCFRKYARPKNRRERRLFEEAKRWLMSEDEAPLHRANNTAPYFSFPYVCQALGFDADYVRHGLQVTADESTR